MLARFLILHLANSSLVLYTQYVKFNGVLITESAETMRARVEPLAVPEDLRRLPEPDPDNAGVGKAYPLIFAAVLYPYSAVYFFYLSTGGT